MYQMLFQCGLNVFSMRTLFSTRLVHALHAVRKHFVRVFQRISLSRARDIFLSQVKCGFHECGMQFSRTWYQRVSTLFARTFQAVLTRFRRSLHAFRMRFQHSLHVFFTHFQCTLYAFSTLYTCVSNGFSTFFSRARDTFLP